MLMRRFPELKKNLDLLEGVENEEEEHHHHHDEDATGDNSI